METPAAETIPLPGHPVSKGDILLVPAPTEDIMDAHRCTVHWSQGFSQKSAKYIALAVVNKMDRKTCFTSLASL